jgi:hypothetical protein
MMTAEKENTFRMLREEELLVTYWGCRWGIHKWTKYREPEYLREGLYDVVSQQRRCSSCNKADRRVISRV